MESQNDEYNWDPLTFAFTVAIGIVAIFFALLTIFQTLVAAGPERLKSGRYAIGPWSRLSRRRLSLYEFRVRTETITPIIRITTSYSDKVLCRAEDTGRNLDIKDIFQKTFVFDEGGIKSWLRDRTPHPLTSLPWLIIREFYDLFCNLGIGPHRPKPPSDHFPATWLGLLHQLRLDYPRIWDQKFTNADYIPSDLPAAPAYGHMITITNLALLACVDLAEPQLGENEWPWVHDHLVDLRFRDHPLLGLVATFQNLSIGSIYSC